MCPIYISQHFVYSQTPEALMNNTTILACNVSVELPLWWGGAVDDFYLFFFLQACLGTDEHLIKVRKILWAAVKYGDMWLNSHAGTELWWSHERRVETYQDF